MKTFEELQDTWNQQTESNLKPEATDLIQKAEAHTKMIKRNHFWTRLILSLSSILLIAYYIWVAAYKHTIFNIGLCIMVTMLLLRIILEWVSEKKLENLNPEQTSKYNSKVVVKECTICKTTSDLHTHHIVFQEIADQNGDRGSDDGFRGGAADAFSALPAIDSFVATDQ